MAPAGVVLRYPVAVWCGLSAAAAVSLRAAQPASRAIAVTSALHALPGKDEARTQCMARMSSTQAICMVPPRRISRLVRRAGRSLVRRLAFAFGFLLIIKGFVNFRAVGRGTWMRKTIAPLPEDPEDEQPPSSR
jgi:hypothetical protein